jgi:hypothetical protein
MPGFSKLRALARAIYDRFGAHHPWTYASAIASGRSSPSSPLLGVEVDESLRKSSRKS